MLHAELDVRELAKPEKHPTIFRRYQELAVGESFVLVNNHDPKHLRAEFEVEYPDGYGWEYVERGPKVWQIRITKVASTSLPRVLGDTAVVALDRPDTGGAIWKLTMAQRDLDSNIVQLLSNDSIGTHVGPDLDVLLVVLAGAGRITTEVGVVELRPGSIAWLPRRSRREFTAGPDGLRYLTVHQRRPSLGLDIGRAPTESGDGSTV